MRPEPGRQLDHQNTYEAGHVAISTSSLQGGTLHWAVRCHQPNDYTLKRL
jgi:hypothetical protein